MKNKTVIALTLLLLLLIAYLYLEQPVHQIETIDSKSVEPAITVERPKRESLKNDKLQVVTNSDEAPSVLAELSCNEFREKHPKKEEAFNAILAEIYMSPNNMMGDGPYAEMDFLSLRSLSNAGDKEAQMYLGAWMTTKAATGFDLYGPKSLRVKLAKEDVNKHQIDLKDFKNGSNYLFDSAVNGKLGGLLELKIVTNIAVRRMILNKVHNPEAIKAMLANTLTYNQLLGFVHKSDLPIAKMFTEQSKEYDREQIEKHFKKWLPETNEEELSKNIDEIVRLSKAQFTKLKKKWVEQREFYGFEVHPKLLSAELNTYLVQVSKRCWS